MDRYYVPYPYYAKQRKPYGFANFLLDAFMILLTQGLWIIWIIIRQAKR